MSKLGHVNIIGEASINIADRHISQFALFSLFDEVVEVLDKAGACEN